MSPFPAAWFRRGSRQGVHHRGHGGDGEGGHDPGRRGDLWPFLQDGVLAGLRRGRGRHRPEPDPERHAHVRQCATVVRVG